MVDEIPTFKVVLVGDGGTGKTAFVKRFLTGKFCEEYTSTEGVHIQPLTFQTTRGRVRFVVWDTAGASENRGLGDAYCIGAAAAVIMCNAKDLDCSSSVRRWQREIVGVCGRIPTIVVGNKADRKARLLSKWSLLEVRAMTGLRAVYTSVKEDVHLEKPFVFLASRLLADERLRFLPISGVNPWEGDLGRRIVEQTESGEESAGSDELDPISFGDSDQ